MTESYYFGHSGYQDGYPVLFDSHISRTRTVELLTYLRDGGLLNDQLSKSMSLQVYHIKFDNVFVVVALTCIQFINSAR